MSNLENVGAEIDIGASEIRECGAFEASQEWQGISLKACHELMETVADAMAEIEAGKAALNDGLARRVFHASEQIDNGGNRIMSAVEGSYSSDAYRLREEISGLASRSMDQEQALLTSLATFDKLRQAIGSLATIQDSLDSVQQSLRDGQTASEDLGQMAEMVADDAQAYRAGL